MQWDRKDAKSKAKKKPSQSEIDSLNAKRREEVNMASIDDLYGDGKAYPEPYQAGYNSFHFFHQFSSHIVCTSYESKKQKFLNFPYFLLAGLSGLSLGRIPSVMMQQRFRKRFNREYFLYSVRFRNGPLGITFDNRVSLCL